MTILKYLSRSQFSSVAQLCPTLCHFMDCSMQASLSITNSQRLLSICCTSLLSSGSWEVFVIQQYNFLHTKQNDIVKNKPNFISLIFKNPWNFSKYLKNSKIIAMTALTGNLSHSMYYLFSYCSFHSSHLVFEIFFKHIKHLLP